MKTILIYSQFFSPFLTYTFIGKTLLEMKISFFLLPALSGHFASRHFLFFISVAATGCALFLSSQTDHLSCRCSACTMDCTALFPLLLPVHNFNCFHAFYRFHHYFFIYKWTLYLWNEPSFKSFQLGLQISDYIASRRLSLGLDIF